MYVTFVKSSSGEYWNRIWHSSEVDEAERRGELRLRNMPKGSEYKVVVADDLASLSDRYLPDDFAKLTTPKRKPGRPRKTK